MGLSYIRRKNINEFAESVFKVFELETPIKDMSDVVNMLGGTVVYDSNIDPLCDGYAEKNEGKHFSIHIDLQKSRERINFIIAHELGHLFLHMGFMTDWEKWKEVKGAYYRYGSNASEEEYEANEFAGAFLMPGAEYRKVMLENCQNGRVDTSKVANYFNVPIDVASMRGKLLGFLQW